MYGLSPETNGQEEEIRCEKETFGITSGEKSTVGTRKDQRELQILEDHKRSVNSSRNSLIQSYMNNQNNQSGESLLYQQNNRSVTSVTSSKNKSLPLPLHLHHQQDQPLILQIHISPKSQFWEEQNRHISWFFINVTNFFRTHKQRRFNYAQ